MINEALVNHYFSMPRISISNKNQLGKVESDMMYISMLNKSAIDWTYEIIGEYFIDDLYNVTVAVFIPGEMRMGLGTTDKEFAKEYRMKGVAKAVAMACKQLRVGSVVSDSNGGSNKGGNTNDSNTSSNGQGDNNRQESQSTNQGTDTVKEDKNNSNDNANQTQTQNNGKPKYTQIQVDKMLKFKETYEIENDEQLVNYIKAWDKTLISKSQLTPNNIDNFLEWIDKLDEKGI